MSQRPSNALGGLVRSRVCDVKLPSLLDKVLLYGVSDVSSHKNLVRSGLSRPRGAVDLQAQ